VSKKRRKREEIDCMRFNIIKKRNLEKQQKKPDSSLIFLLLHKHIIEKKTYNHECMREFNKETKRKNKLVKDSR
jgi:hypothetical protein